MSAVPFWAWTAFGVLVAAMLVIDLGLAHRRAHEVGLREASAWAAVWVGMALVFNAGVWVWLGPTKALEFLTGYLVEESLSVDNLFVFLVIFKYFALPRAQHHRVLVWGVLGAVLLRGLMIGFGVALISAFHWILYVFGALLLLTAYKLATQDEESVDPGRNAVVRLVRRFVPVLPRYAGDAFFVRVRGALHATPLFIVLVAVESTDVMFAIDSIPAIFAITRDPFIVFTSNIFAVMGLRAIFFVVAGMIHRFRYLRPGLALVLGFIGLKMLFEGVSPVPVGVSLLVVGLILGGSVGLSLAAERREGRARRGGRRRR